MSSSAASAIEIAGVKKTYLLGKGAKANTLAEAIGGVFRRDRSAGQRRTLEALSGVDLTVTHGEAVGIVGRNGAGKSTLLKVLTRVTPPSAGEIRIFGRVGSLLEVGTGFHPELTGRENIYLNGSILGMRKEEVERSFDEIVAFADVAKFLETPVKRYSSGMYVRLAFAVAAHLPTEILLIDEVLAVGDAAFKSRSINKMKDVVNEGRTILFVSHHMPSVVELCTRGVVLDHGTVAFDGSAAEAARVYFDSMAEGDLRSAADRGRRNGTGQLRLARFDPTREAFLPDEPKEFDFEIDVITKLESDVSLSVHVKNEIGDEIVQCDSKAYGFWLDGDRPSRGRFTMEHPWLQPGRYTVDVLLQGNQVVDAAIAAGTFDVLPQYPYPVSVNQWSVGGQVLGKFSCTEHAGPTASPITNNEHTLTAARNDAPASLADDRERSSR